MENPLQLSQEFNELNATGFHDLQQQISQLSSFPGHVAIIMDGNRRWAQAKSPPLPVIEGHCAGYLTLRKLVAFLSQLYRATNENVVKVLTVYAFSTENWKRSDAEVDAIMMLATTALLADAKNFHRNNIRLRSIGDSSRLPKPLQQALDDAVKLTVGNTGLLLVVALNYGGYWDFTQGIKNMLSSVAETPTQTQPHPSLKDSEKKQKRKSQDGIEVEALSHCTTCDNQSSLLFSNGSFTLSNFTVTPGFVEKFLPTGYLPPVDLLIRTGGEKRLSNFLPWQMAYAELLFLDMLWPDFTYTDFVEALKFFDSRNRRFGGSQNVAPMRTG